MMPATPRLRPRPSGPPGPDAGHKPRGPARSDTGRRTPRPRWPWVAVLLVAACSDGPTYPYPVGTVAFTSPPMDLSGASSYVGIGSSKPLPSDHGGFFLRDPFTLPAHIPVFAVADGVIHHFGRGIRSIPEWAEADVARLEYEDWSLNLKVSTTLEVNYAHVSALHPRVFAATGDPPPDEIGRHMFLEVRAGDTIGYVGPHMAMDFSVTDRALTPRFVNPSRYPVDFIYGASGIDYFVPPIHAEILAITERQVPPRGGRHDHDIDGRIIGNWFLEGTTSFTQWSRQLSIVYHHVLGDQILITDGSSMKDVSPLDPDLGEPRISFVRGNAPRPEDVGREQGMVKYELIISPTDRLEFNPTQGVMLVELTEMRKMRVEVFDGMLPDQVTGFTAAARIYER